MAVSLRPLHNAFIIAITCCTGCVLPESLLPPTDTPLSFNTALAPLDTADADETPRFDAQLLFEAIPDKAGSHAPAIVALPNDELLAAWFSYAGPHELEGAAIYMARRTTDGWSQPWRHIDRPQADGNPVFYAEGNRVWLFQAVVAGGWSTSRIEMQQSFDAGKSWTAPTWIPGPLGSNVRFPPLRTLRGELLLPAYDDLLGRSLLFASANGNAWRWRSVIAAPVLLGALQPAIVELESGRLLAVLRNGGADWLWVTASDDAGRSWTPPRDSNLPNPGSPTALTKLRDGSLLLVFNNDRTARRPLAASRSIDDGETWSAPRVLVDGDGAYAYPAVAQSADGLIHVVYSHDRRSIGYLRFNDAWLTTPKPTRD